MSSKNHLMKNPRFVAAAANLRSLLEKQEKDAKRKTWAEQQAAAIAEAEKHPTEMTREERMSAMKKATSERKTRLYAALLSGASNPTNRLNFTLADGKKASVDTDAEYPMKGDEMLIDGEPAPDGTHVTPDGDEIRTRNGMIVEIQEVDMAEYFQAYKTDEISARLLKRRQITTYRAAKKLKLAGT